MRPLLALALLPCLGAAEPFAHERAGALAPDPAIVWGTLPNGLRYAMLEHAQPQGKAVLRLRVAAGSLQETDAQQGLAHLLEHLAFNGTTHYPPGRLVTDLQHLGLQFGAHTNAHTSFDETVYKLDLPDATSATLTTGLTVLGDWAGGMLLEEAEVTRERSVVLAEMRDRDGWQMRAWRARFAARYAGTLLPQRFPIGTPEVVGSATAARLRAFYDQWYRPQDLLLVIVADTPTAQVLPLIAPALGHLTDRGNGGPRPERGRLTPTTAPMILTHYAAEADDTSLSWGWIAEAGPAPVYDERQARREVAWQLTGRILGRRIAALVEADPTCPLLNGSSDHGRWLDLRHTSFEGRARPGRALDGVALLIREGRRLRQYGPTAEELATEATAFAQDLTTAVAQAGDRRSRDIAQGLVNLISQGEVPRSAAQERDLLNPLLTTSAPTEIIALLAADLDQPGREVVEITGRDPYLNTPEAEAQIRARVTEALSAPVEPPQARAAVTWAYATDPQAPVGEASQTQDADHGLWKAERPGLAVTVKATGFQPGRIAINLRLVTPSAPDPVLAGLLDRAFLAAGLGRHADDDLDRLFAGSALRLTADVDDGAFVLQGMTTPDQVERALDRLRAHLVDPGWRDSAFQRARTAWDEELASAEQDPGAVADHQVMTHLLGQDPSRRPVTRAHLAASTIDTAAARIWLAPLLAEAPLSITVVGDIADPQAMVAAVLRRFPARSQALPTPVTDVATARAALLPGRAWAPGRIAIEVPGPVAKTALRVAWSTDDQLDIRQSRRRNLLAACLGDRLREDLRQRLGAAYSPGAGHQPSDRRRGEGFLLAATQVEPAQAALVEARILALAEQLAQDGVPTELLQRMLAPTLKALPEVLRRDDWWLGIILSRSWQQPLRLGWADTIQTDHAAITAAEISDLARTTFVPGKALIVIATCPGPKP